MFNGFTFKNPPQYTHQALSRQSGQRCKHLRFRETGVGSYTKTNSAPIEDNYKNKPTNLFLIKLKYWGNILHVLTLHWLSTRNTCPGITCICWHGGTGQFLLQLLCHFLPPYCFPPLPPAAAASLFQSPAPVPPRQWWAAQAPWLPTAQMP